MNRSIVVIIVVIILVLGGGAYLVVNNMNKETDTATPVNTAQEAAESSATNQSTTSQTAETDQTSEQTSQNKSVTIKNFAFSPNAITIKKGTTVTWTNEDGPEHNAFSEQEGGPKGGLLKKGESYSFTFEKSGTFNYICTPHPHMKGTVTVTD